jgi:hypothetical protein
MARHPADLVSLAFGLLFAALGLVLLSGGAGALSLAWLGPLVAVALGGLLILAGRSARTEPDDQLPEG